MSLHILDDEQRGDRRATSMRLGRCADPDPFEFRRREGRCKAAPGTRPLPILGRTPCRPGAKPCGACATILQ